MTWCEVQQRNRRSLGLGRSRCLPELKINSTALAKLVSQAQHNHHDPTEPPRSVDYPYPAIAHEPQVQEIVDEIAQQGLHPTPVSLGLTDQDDDPTNDSEVSGIVPALKFPNVTLRPGAKVTCLYTNSSGKAVRAVGASIGGQSHLFLGEIVVLACGAINSAALLLNSAHDLWPKGTCQPFRLGRTQSHEARDILRRATEQS